MLSAHKNTSQSIHMSNFGRENHHEAMSPWDMPVLTKVTYSIISIKKKRKKKKITEKPFTSLNAKTFPIKRINLFPKYTPILEQFFKQELYSKIQYYNAQNTITL